MALLVRFVFSLRIRNQSTSHHVKSIIFQNIQDKTNKCFYLKIECSSINKSVFDGIEISILLYVFYASWSLSDALCVVAYPILENHHREELIWKTVSIWSSVITWRWRLVGKMVDYASWLGKLPWIGLFLKKRWWVYEIYSKPILFNFRVELEWAWSVKHYRICFLYFPSYCLLDDLKHPSIWDCCFDYTAR